MKQLQKSQKEIFSDNFNRLLEEKDKTQADVYHALKNIERQTVSAWACGKAVPRMDRIQQLADFFGCQKSDLIEPYEEDMLSSIMIKARALNKTGISLLENYLDFLLLSDSNKEII